MCAITLIADIVKEPVAKPDVLQQIFLQLFMLKAYLAEAIITLKEL